MKEATYKPLLYTTTVRNPERYKDFMFLLRKYDGQVLTNDIIKQFERDTFQVGLYRPAIQTDSIRRKWSSTSKGEFADFALSDKETLDLYNLNDPSQNPNLKGHKEAGFDKGWPSRFDTQFKLMKRLGFVYYNIGEKIEFSKTGIYLAETVSITVDPMTNGISREICKPENEQIAFLQALSNEQRCNPFIREKNDNNPLTLLLRVIQLLNKDVNFNGCGISYKELPLLIFWKNNDAVSLYERICKLRKDYGYNPSDEIIQDICVSEILGGYKVFKLKSITQEYPDDFIRKMRMTGLVTFRGGGRFIDINHNEDSKIDYIIQKYSTYQKYTDEKLYFSHVASIDTQLVSIKAVSSCDASKHLSNWLNVYSWDTIKREMNNLQRKSSSSDNVLKFIPGPARLEFLTALAVKCKLKNVIVKPNYPCDDEGLPTSTAGGNTPDIVCYENTYGITIEVTLAEGRNQTIMEIWPIERHLDAFKTNNNVTDAQCLFVAPSIYSDSRRQIDFVKQTSGHVIRSYTISDFVGFIEKTPSLYIK